MNSALADLLCLAALAWACGALILLWGALAVSARRSEEERREADRGYWWSL